MLTVVVCDEYADGGYACDGFVCGGGNSDKIQK